MIYLGSHTVNYLWLGSHQVDAAWLGSHPVYPYSVGNAYITPTSLNFPYTSGTSTLNVYDPQNHGWTIQGGATMVSLSRYYGTGNSSITVTASANPEAAVRTSSLTFKDSVTLATTTVSLTQAAAPAPDTVYVTITPGTFSANYQNFQWLEWSLYEDRVGSDLIAGDGIYGYPGYTYTWGQCDYNEYVSPSEYGSYKTVYYEVVALDSDHNVLYNSGIASASVDIPLHPAESIYTIQLPNL